MRGRWYKEPCMVYMCGRCYKKPWMCCICVVDAIRSHIWCISVVGAMRSPECGVSYKEPWIVCVRAKCKKDWGWMHVITDELFNMQQQGTSVNLWLQDDEVLMEISVFLSGTCQCQQLVHATCWPKNHGSFCKVSMTTHGLDMQRWWNIQRYFMPYVCRISKVQTLEGLIHGRHFSQIVGCIQQF